MQHLQTHLFKSVPYASESIDQMQAYAQPQHDGNMLPALQNATIVVTFGYYGVASFEDGDGIHDSCQCPSGTHSCFVNTGELSLCSH